MQKLTAARAKAPKPRPRIVMWNAEDLMKAELPEPKWAIPGILPEGLGILIGGPKLGKSLMSLHFAVSVAIGGRALGAFDVEQGSVLYLALEDVARRLQDRLRKMRVAANLGKHRLRRTVAAHGCGRTRRAGKLAVIAQDARLRIIDTLQCFRPPKKSGETVTPKTTRHADLKRLADGYSVPILLVHHSNKAINHVADGGMKDFLEASLGSQAITGAVDAAIVLSRSRMSKMLTLSLTGRDVEERKSPYRSMSRRFPIGSRVILQYFGCPPSRRRSSRLSARGKNDVAERDSDITGMKTGTVKSALSRLLQKSIVVSDRGKYTSPSSRKVESWNSWNPWNSGTRGTDDDTVPTVPRRRRKLDPDGCSDTKHPDVTVPKVPRVPQVYESDGTVNCCGTDGAEGSSSSSRLS
jgi:hypothetical protein